MKNLIITLMFLPMLSFSQECYTVAKVGTHVEMEEMSKNRIVFGIKQMVEDIISDNVNIVGAIHTNQTHM